jgi:hypothetical protein
VIVFLYDCRDCQVIHFLKRMIGYPVGDLSLTGLSGEAENLGNEASRQDLWTLPQNQSTELLAGATVIRCSEPNQMEIQ